MLEIVKKLRIFKFASDCTLKPRQRDLVNFFDEYKLKSGEKTEEWTLLASDEHNRPLNQLTRNITASAVKNTNKGKNRKTEAVGAMGNDINNLEETLA